jgi:hypothetical protein
MIDLDRDFKSDYAIWQLGNQAAEFLLLSMAGFTSLQKGEPLTEEEIERLQEHLKDMRKAYKAFSKWLDALRYDYNTKKGVSEGRLPASELKPNKKRRKPKQQSK